MTSTDFKHIDGSGLSHLFGLLKDKYGEPEAPYTEVEWVESNGKQFVYLDWKPPIATWGFEADFIIRNTFDTTQAAWNAATNKDHAGALFGTQNSSQNNDIQVLSYTTTGYCRIGGTAGGSASTYDAKWKKDQSRQTMKLHGTTLTRCDGSTLAVTRSSEVANKPYANMTVFACHSGLRKTGSGTVSYPGTVRIYSLKFFDGNTLELDLVGAIRKSDGVTGLYDKVAGKFYPAPECTYGNVVGDLGEPSPLTSAIDGTVPVAYAYNSSNTRMLRAEAPMLSKLEDGQQISLTYLYAIGASYQTTELAGWDDTGNNSYVYVKLTLADGSHTEWIPCFYNGPTRLTTHYYAGHPLLLTYRENMFVGATATGAGSGAFMRGFWCDPNYNTDDVYTRYSDTLTAGLNGVKRYSLNMRDANGNWTSIMNQDNNVAATGKTAYTGGLMLGNVLYHNSSANIAAGGNTGQMKESQGGVDFRYDVNGVTNAAASTELQLRKPIYLVGTVGSDGLFYLDTTKWWTQEPNQTGKVYVQLGTAYSSYYAIFLSVDNPSFVYDGSKLVEYDDSRIQAAETRLSSVESGKVSKLGDTMTGNLVVPMTRIANTYYGVSFGRTTGTPVETILYTGIKWVNGTHMPVIHVTGYAYGLNSPVEFKIGFYFYSNKVGWCGATNMGSWNPGIKLFKHTVDNVDYVAVGFSGSCYFLQLQVDVQDEMGKFVGISLASSLWSWSFLTTTGTIPAADGGVTCIDVPYKADILAPPVNNATGTLAIAHGGTGATTAAAAWTALGGGAIGKKASLAASDIPAHASTATTYGAASTSNYGHAKLSSATDSTSEALAATPKAVKAAYDLATTAKNDANSAMSAATGALVFKITYSISNGNIVGAAHVYSAGAEVTSDHADSCFAWSYRIGTGSAVSLGTGKTKTVAVTTLELGGSLKCDFTPAS